MKRSVFFFILAFCIQQIQLNALDLGVSYAVMATPEEPYLEIYLEIAPGSISWERVDSLTMKAGAELLILVKKGEEIVAFDKYQLNSPALPFPNVLLDVRRLAVPNGNYTLEIKATDLLVPGNFVVYTKPVTVNIQPSLYLSEIHLLRAYAKDTSQIKHPLHKNGYVLEPLPFNFYEKSATKLAFYTEIYYTSTVVTDPTYFFRYIIEKDLGNDQFQLVSVGNLKKKPSIIDAGMAEVGISDMETGNYVLTVELRNKRNELLTSRKLAFQRSNPYLNLPDSTFNAESIKSQFVKELDEKALVYSLKAISPLVNMGDDPEELKNILKKGDLDAMRFFLFRYFVKIDPNNPEIAWRKHVETANVVDKLFHSGFRYGFETDRGRTYMKYGKPDDLIHVEDDPAAPPYEIWVYYNFPKTVQRNVKFLFYNPSLAGEDYIMLHSTARGEINNPKWEITLYKRNAQNEFDGDNPVDADRMQRNVNRNARVYFEDF